MQSNADQAARIRISATAGPDLEGMRLDQAAAILFPDFSRGRLQKWLRSGELTVDGRSRKVTHRISAGEALQLDALPELQEEVLAQDIPLDIIHSDDDLLVLNKPAGLVVHPAAGNPDGTLQNALLYFDPGLAALPRSGIVHRLDKDTSGVMVVARSLRAHNRLVEQLQTRTMSRIYETLVGGETRAKGTIDAPIGRHPVDRKRMAVVTGGKPAVTHFRLLRRFNRFSHLEVSLESGRTHQIRVHMQHIGHPMVGDPVYGKVRRVVKGLPAPLGEAIRLFPRQALHARRLSLVHPADNRLVSFETARPPDLEELLSVFATLSA
jgi:23S rRNA pseudouridine1911/1915/1917 synthase